MRLGILGGTFDPIHEGHLLLADAAQKQFRLDKILFIPAGIPPNKTAKADITPASYRYRMTELALENHPVFEASDLEIGRAGVSYTVDTLQVLKKNYPKAELFLIIGADAAHDLSQWRKPEEIQKLATVAAAKRPGHDATSAPSIQWIEMPLCPFSSSEIREKIRRGEPVPPLVLPKTVEAYIYQQHLYQGPVRESAR